MQNYIENTWCSAFSVLDQKNPFWVNLVRKIKIVSLSWILVPRLVGMRRIQWRCSLFLLFTINIFLRQNWSKKSKMFNVKIDTKTNLSMQNSMVVFICFRLKIATFLGKFGRKNRNCQLSWKSVLRLSWIWRIQ